MLDLGFDEGGKVGDRLLVSVQIGSTASMRRLQRHWRDAVDSAGIRFFHSKDYQNIHHGEFAGMSTARRRRLLKTLAALLHKYADAGITAWVNTALFDDAVSETIRSKYTTPYAFALCMCMMAAHLYKESVGRGGENTNLRIATGHKHLSQAMLRLTDLKSEIRFHIVTVVSSAMNDCAILQAADMLAYGEWRKMNGEDNDEIYVALHRQGSRYRTLTFECDVELIELLSTLDEIEAARKAFGMRTRRIGQFKKT